jgi:hypothetical protein
MQSLTTCVALAGVLCSPLRCRLDGAEGIERRINSTRRLEQEAMAMITAVPISGNPGWDSRCFLKYWTSRGHRQDQGARACCPD